MTNIINGMRPIHPGAVLREPRINDVVRERRAVTVDTALRLAKYFGTSAEFWMGQQTDFDMATARATMGDVLARIVSREDAGEVAHG